MSSDQKIVHLKNSSETQKKPGPVDTLGEAYKLIAEEQFNATDCIVILIDRRPATGLYSIDIRSSGELNNVDLVSAFEVAKDFTLRKKMGLQ